MSELRFSSPAASFDSPFDMLLGCHQRVRRFCALVEDIAAHLEQNGCDATLAHAAGSALHYFDTAGRDHHADEEQDLFPALREAVPPERRASVAALVERLERDHELLDALWASLRARLVALNEGRDTALPTALARAFTVAHAAHIDEEEHVLLPLARRLLGPDAVAMLGASMAARRNVR